METARIMICEDEGLVAEELRQRLEESGHTVTGVVAHGERAIELARSSKPDLALLDIRLRGNMRGTEVAKILAEDMDIPCIFLTAYADEETVEEAKESNPLGYLLKPVHERELETAIELGLASFRKQRAVVKELEEQRRSWDKALHAAGMGAHVVSTLKELIEAERDRSIKQVCSGVAHHLNNTLASIVGNLEWLDEAKMLPGYESRFLSQALKGCERAKSIIQKLLWFSGQGLFQIEFTDLREVVERVILEERKSVPSHVQLRSVIPSTKCMCLADKLALTHVVRGLLINAIRAIPDQGEVFVSVGSEIMEAPEHKNRQAKPGNFIVIRVADTGKGIDPEDLPTLMEPFNSLHSDIDHLGLGLPSCSGIALALGGWLDIQSRAGEGTVASVYVPHLEGDSKSAQASKTMNRADEVVLIIGPKSQDSEKVAKVIEGTGATIKLEHDGQQALKLLLHRRNNFSRIVIDYDLGSAEVEGILHFLRATRSLPQVLLVGKPPQELLAEFKKLTYMHKPIDLGNFTSWLDDKVPKMWDSDVSGEKVSLVSKKDKGNPASDSDEN